MRSCLPSTQMYTTSSNTLCKANSTNPAENLEFTGFPPYIPTLLFSVPGVILPTRVGWTHRPGKCECGCECEKIPKTSDPGAIHQDNESIFAQGLGDKLEERGVYRGEETVRADCGCGGRSVVGADGVYLGCAFEFSVRPS